MKRLFLFTLLFCMALPSLAQERKYANASPTFWNNLLTQTQTNCASKDVAIRKQTLRNMIYFANNYRLEAPLHQIVNRLIGVYERDKNEEVRELALAAIVSIGSDNARAYVNRHVEKKELPRSGALIADVLAGFEEAENNVL